MKQIKKIYKYRFFVKLLHWEYWPFAAVYGPVYLYWLVLALRHKSFFFFNAANPSIKNGGFLMESKKDIYDLLPEGYYPVTLAFKPGTSASVIIEQVKEKKLSYPLIGKPDIGMQGIGVKKLDSDTDVIAYAAHSDVDFLVQEFVTLPNEVGIFYYRLPGEASGHISGIVSKEFLSVTGDGTSSIENLLHQEPRYVLQLPYLKKNHGQLLQQIPEKGAIQLLVPYGNHARGAKFIDTSHLINEKLEYTINAICSRVKGFYYGRLDLRYNTWPELEEGKHISIIELNGAGSEPTHMYDPKHSLFFAWKEITRHWKLLSAVSRINHKKNNVPYMSFADGMAMLKQSSRYVKHIKTKHYSSAAVDTAQNQPTEFPDFLFT